jgi:hypothetical protein
LGQRKPQQTMQQAAETVAFLTWLRLAAERVGEEAAQGRTETVALVVAEVQTKP